MFAIYNNFKFGEIKECEYNIVKKSSKGISGNITFKSIDRDIIDLYDNNPEKFDVILNDEGKYIILLDVDILNNGNGLPISDIETDKEYTFIANPNSRVECSGMVESG